MHRIYLIPFFALFFYLPAYTFFSNYIGSNSFYMYIVHRLSQIKHFCPRAYLQKIHKSKKQLLVIDVAMLHRPVSQ